MARKNSYFSHAAILAFCLAAGMAFAQEPVKQTAEQRAALTAEARSLWREAQRLDKDRNVKDAVVAGRQMLEVYRKLLGNYHDDIAFIADWLADRYELLDDFESARWARRGSLNIRMHLSGAGNGKVADARLALANVELLARLTSEQRQQLALAKSRNSDAVRLHRAGRFQDALRAAKEALLIRKQLVGEMHPDYATTLNNLSAMYDSIGEYAQAETLCNRALEIRKQVLGDTHPDYAASLNSLAFRYNSIGNYTRAEPLYLQALEIRKQALGDTDPDYGTSLNNLAHLYNSLGNYARAEPLYRQASAVFKKAFGETHPSFATSLNNLALLYHSTGDYARAEPLIRQALEIRKQAQGETHPDYATSLNSLAFLYNSMGDYARAEPLYRQASEVFKQALGETHPDYATSLSNLAHLYLSRREYARAEPLCRQASEVFKKAFGEAHPSYATTLNNLALLYHVTGDYARSEPLYRQVLEINKKVFGETHPHYANSLMNLGGLFESMGDYALAEPSYRQALEVSRKNLESSAFVQSERQQLAMVQAARDHIDNYLILATAAPLFRENAYCQLLAWKGAVLARQQTMRTARDNPLLTPTYLVLERTTAQLARLSLITPSGGQQDTWQRTIAELSEQKERLEAQLAAMSSAFRDARSSVTLEGRRAALPEDAVLIDFLESFADVTVPQPGPTTGAAGKVAKRVVEPRYLAFLVRKSGPVELLVLGKPKEIEAQLDIWRADFGQSDDSRAAGLWLREHVWEPIEKRLDAQLAGGAPAPRLVLISPDGALGKLPFAALPGKEPGTYLLEERHRLFAMIPSAAALAVATESANPRSPAKNLLVLGGVDYNRASATDLAATTAPAAPKKFGMAPRDAADDTFEPLTATEGELATLDRKYRQNFGMEGITTLEKSAATEAALRREAPLHKYLHLATHGFFAAPRFKSALARSATTSDRFGPEKLLSEQSISGYHPNLLSGIALAGANQPPDDGDDEILTAEEVQTLDLRGTELVVLSACETGLGKTAGGEGLLGLQRAFQVAGAKTVIASLWKVDDVATRDLMERFYDNLWNKNMGKLEALREAQLWMLKVRGPRGLTRLEKDAEAQQRKTLPPYYWAAWVLSGDWR